LQLPLPTTLKVVNLLTTAETTERILLEEPQDTILKKGGRRKLSVTGSVRYPVTTSTLTHVISALVITTLKLFGQRQ